MKLRDHGGKPFSKGYLGKFSDKATEYDLIFDEQSKIKARFSSGRVEDFDGHRIQTDVRIQTYNYMKESELSGSEIRRGGTVTICLNNFQVYEFFFRQPEDALLRARNILFELYEHPVQAWRSDERERWVGKPVFYRDHPCHIKYFIWDQGCVLLETDDGKSFPSPAWDDERWSETSSTLKDDILSPHIWWWRKK